DHDRAQDIPLAHPHYLLTLKDVVGPADGELEVIGQRVLAGHGEVATVIVDDQNAFRLLDSAAGHGPVILGRADRPRDGQFGQFGRPRFWTHARRLRAGVVDRRLDLGEL